jgi:hypothetical protein
MSPATLSHHQLGRIFASMELERPLPEDWRAWRTWLGPAGDHPLREQLARASARARRIEDILWQTRETLESERRDFGQVLAELERRTAARQVTGDLEKEVDDE